jgi:K+ transporter
LEFRGFSQPHFELRRPAIVLEGTPTQGNIFYQLCPSLLLTPLVVLATFATIIASQSIITGAFSMTRQAIALGWMPRLRVTQSSEEGFGQIYVGAVNWLLMIATLALTIIFRKSDNLAAAYGIAVSLTMLREQSRANASRSSVSPISSGALKPATDLWNEQMC